MHASQEVRWAAVAQLQRRVSRFPSNSFESAVAEHAIGLVLSPDRLLSDYLAKNARDDAKKVVSARIKRGFQKEVSFQRNGDQQIICPEIERLCTAYAGATSADHVLIWADAYSRLHDGLVKRNKTAAVCLDLWRDGFSEKETATSLAISQVYVKKLRGLIRSMASQLLTDLVLA